MKIEKEKMLHRISPVRFRAIALYSFDVELVVLLLLAVERSFSLQDTDTALDFDLKNTQEKRTKNCIHIKMKSQPTNVCTRTLNGISLVDFTISS